MFSRRRFLEIVGLSGGLVALRQFTAPLPALASPQSPRLFLFAYFEGGWDQLLAFDPRSAVDPRFQKAAAYAQNGSGIWPAYELVQDAAVKALLATNKSGVQTRGQLTFGPAVPPSLLAHAGDLSIVRGLNMETLTHEVGRRYFLTGKFPRGLAASGSAATTVVAAQEGSAAILPNLAIATESYNEGQPAYASPVRVLSAGDLLNVLRPIGAPLPANAAAALAAFEDADDTCEQHARDGDGLVSFYRASRKRARSLADADVATLFQFNSTPPPAAVKSLFDALKITSPADLAGPKGRAAIAAQALARGVSQAVSVALSTGLDDHFDWDVDHATSLRAGLDALGLLIAHLQATPYMGPGGGSVWSHTTLLAFSEFSRTPLINSRDGRDHHLTSSCLLGGPGLRGGAVVGASTDVRMAFRPVNPKSGAPDDKGVVLRPADVHATVFRSMGLRYDHIANQTPQLIDALLK